jgi:hypothetical protein
MSLRLSSRLETLHAAAPGGGAAVSALAGGGGAQVARAPGAADGKDAAAQAAAAMAEEDWPVRATGGRPPGALSRCRGRTQAAKSLLDGLLASGARGARGAEWLVNRGFCHYRLV